MNYYILNKENTCIGASSLTGSVSMPGMVETNELDLTNIGKIYNCETLMFEEKAVE